MINFSPYSQYAVRGSKRAPFSYKSELLQLQSTSVLFAMNKLKNGMSECCFISCVSLHVDVGEKERRASAPLDKSGDTLMSLTAQH